jgi:hypothetical protein
VTVAFRSAELDDAPFIVSSWSRAFKGSNSAGMIADEDWATVMHPQIQKVLARPGARAIVAYEKTDPTFIYGFVAGDTDERVPVVFFAYVKEPYRRTGVARGLFAALGVDPLTRFRYVCWTPVVAELLQTGKFPRTKHDPHFARYPKPRGPETWKR